jgi:hypothetical protein
VRSKNLRRGDAVKWRSSQGPVIGKVVKKQTRKTKIKQHKVAASNSSPEYIVKSDKTGALAAHKATSLKRVSKS